MEAENKEVYLSIGLIISVGIILMLLLIILSPVPKPVFITNSNGHSFPFTRDGLQDAINDLEPNGGYVYLPKGVMKL